MICNQNHFGSGELKIKIILEVVIWKSKSRWKSNDFKKILKYSLYSSNVDVFCLFTALAIMYQMKHVIST